MSENEKALFFSRIVCNKKQKETMHKWMNSSFRHSCNLTKHESQVHTLVCGININFKALIEYGDITLS